MANAIERMIEAVSPSWAYKRAAYRNALRSYDAATHSRRAGGSWRRMGGSAIDETGFALTTLRERSRDLRRNNPYASKAIRKNTATAIGPGIVPQAKDRAKRIRSAVEDAWRAHAVEGTDIDPEGRTNVYGLMRRIFDAIQESGEVLVRRIVTPRSMGLLVPLQLQILEADHLDHSRTSLQLADDGSFIVQGVEFDSGGRRAAYWIHPEHPGRRGTFTGIRGSERVPAGELIHTGRWERIGQVRYVPWGAPAMLRLKDLDEMEDAQVTRLKIAACFAGFIHDAGAGGPDGPFGALAPNPTAEPGKNPAETLARISPGALVDLPNGKSITFAKPEGIEGYEDTMRVSLRAIAAAYGPTYEALTGDLSGVNFSSARMGEISYREEITAWRQDFLIPQICNGIWKWFVTLGADAGAFSRPPMGVAWTPPRREMLDPVKETRGMVAMARAGFSTLGDLIRANGYDPEEVFQTLAQEADLLDELELDLTTHPRKPGKMQESEGTSSPGEDGGGPKTEA